MYNEQFKQSFIDFRCESNMTIKEKLELIFEWTAPMERRLNKDLCNFSMQQILELYKSKLTDSQSVLLNIHSQLSIYAKYCYSKNMIDDGQNHFLEIDRKALVSCLHSGLVDISIITRKDLLSLISDRDNVYEKFIVLGIFEGIMGTNYIEFIQAKHSDIDPETNTIKLYGGRELSISPELVSFGLEAGDTYVYWNKNGSQRKFINDNEGWIIKGKPNIHGDRPKPRVVQLTLVQLEDESNNPIFRTSALRASGIIDMVESLMQADNISGYKECATKYKKDIIARYGASLFRRMFWDNEYRKYIDD